MKQEAITTQEKSVETIENAENQINIINNINDEIETLAEKSLSNEDEISKRLLSLNASKIEVDEVINRLKVIDSKISDSKKGALEKVSGMLNGFYAEHFKSLDKSVVAEFKMRPIYDKYIKLDKEGWDIWKKREKIKKKNPEADLTALDPFRIRSVNMGHDIFENAENYAKIPEFVEKNKYNETNIEDLKTYQEYYQYRRFDQFPGEMVRGWLHKENESEILSKLYAIQLNQIREKLHKNDSSIKENLDVFFQPGTALYSNEDRYRVFSKEKSSSQNTDYSRSVTDRIKSFEKAIQKDDIVLSSEQKSILRDKVLDIFESSQNDLSINLHNAKDITSFVDLCDFSNEQKKLIQSFIFSLMLKSEKRHWFSVAFSNKEFPYTQDQIETIFTLVKQSDIHPEGIRVPHSDRYNNSDESSQYDVISTNELNQFPFTTEQKSELGEVISASILRQFESKIKEGDFQYFVDFRKNNGLLETSEFITKEQFDRLVSQSESFFLAATETYIEKYLSFSDGDTEKVEMKTWYSNKTELVPKREMVARNFNLARVADLIKQLVSFPKDKEKSAELISKIPWVDSITKMMTIQKRPRRAEYDPWITDLTLLVQASLMNENMSIHNPQDGEVLLEYVKRIGPRNLPNYFALFKSLIDAGSVSLLDVGIKNEIKSSFGIDVDELCKNDPKNLNLIFAETEKFRASFRSDLIDENNQIVQKCFASKYGQEFFSAAFGNSGFGYGGEYKKILETYGKSSEKRPELFKLPEGYIPVTFEIPEFSSKETSDDLEDNVKITELLQNPDLLISYSNIYNAVESLGTKSRPDQIDSYNKSLLGTFTKEIQAIEGKLEEINLEKDVNKKAVENLTKRKEMLSLQMNNFNESIKGLMSMNVENIMETYQEFIPDTFPQKQEVLMQLSLEDMSTRFPEEFNKIKNPSLVQKSPSLDSVSIFSEFIRINVGEHYLSKKHGEGDAIRSDQKNLIKYLKKVWGTQDFETKILSVTNEKLAALERGELSNQSRPITIIPSKGIQRIISGHLGSACTSRKAGELAEGKFPNITSYSMVIDKDTQKERFVGSFLVIETQTKDNRPILVIRANNPSQNMLNTIDTKDLTDKVFDEVRNVAKRRNIELVGVALGAGVASNRTFVTDYHQNAAKEGIALKDNAETNFNGHPIYNHTALI